ncbi:MAG: septum formation initiator family protein [Clostridia bacterium]|nr:septum formation initiator family protein [Clostridia bacterium]
MRRKHTALFIKVLAVFFAAVGIFTVMRLQLQRNELLEEMEQLRAEYEENAATIEELKEDLEAPVDLEYIIRVARERLGLCMPYEIVFYNDLAH